VNSNGITLITCNMISGQQLQNLHVEALTESSSVTYKLKKKSQVIRGVYMYTRVSVCAHTRTYICSKNIFCWNPINSEVRKRRCKISISWSSPPVQSPPVMLIIST
jgi:hypothetical protein